MWGRQTTTLVENEAVELVNYPELCTARPMRQRVDDQAYTREETGTPNAQVCLRSSSDQFLEFFMPRIVTPGLIGGTNGTPGRPLVSSVDKRAKAVSIAEESSAR